MNIVKPVPGVITAFNRNYNVRRSAHRDTCQLGITHNEKEIIWAPSGKRRNGFQEGKNGGRQFMESDLSGTAAARTSPTSGSQTTSFSSAAHSNTRPPPQTTLATATKAHGLQQHPTTTKIISNTASNIQDHDTSSKTQSKSSSTTASSARGQHARGTDKS